MEINDTEITVKLCCEFAEFIDWNSFRKLPSWDKWRKITCNMEDYVELTNDEMFNLFLNSRNGN